MKPELPKTEEEWRHFHFPRRDSPTPAWPYPALTLGDDADYLEGGWQHRHHRRVLENLDIRQCIYLNDLDTCEKIDRLLLVLKRRSDLDPEGLLRALDAAALSHYAVGLATLMEEFRGARLEWPVEGHESLVCDVVVQKKSPDAHRP